MKTGSCTDAKLTLPLFPIGLSRKPPFEDRSVHSPRFSKKIPSARTGAGLKKDPRCHQYENRDTSIGTAFQTIAISNRDKIAQAEIHVLFHMFGDTFPGTQNR